jgi:tetratricopeptide (TPR) repeat protein
MAKFNKSFALAILMVCSLAGGEVGAKNPAIQKGIEAYNAKSYAEALSFFEPASKAAPKDELVHYYLGLTYQALNRNADAEREYGWNYRNGKDADLKYKSWQGLTSVARLRRGRAGTVTAARTETRTTQAISPIAVKAGGSPYRAEQGKAPTSESGFTAGCFKH